MRPFAALLLALDERLGLVVQRTNEALVGQMRMAWWRDVIAKDPASRPSGEPLIAQIAAAETRYDSAALHYALGNIIDGWDLLLAKEDWTDETLLAHADMRSKGVFGAFVRLEGRGPSNKFNLNGQHWALNDLANICGNDVSNALNSLPAVSKLPKNHRPLSLLLMAARQQNSGAGRFAGLRLALHGLTGL